MAKTLLGLYAVSVFALLAAAVSIWRLHCESFGCMGVGVAWFAWVIAFFIVLGVGLFVRIKVTSSSSLCRISNATWWLQLTLGAALLVIWAVNVGA